MTYDYELNLVKVTYGENNIGDAAKTLEKRPVYASKLDYKNKNFYQAAASGLKPEITFAINKYEYDDEEEVEFEGKAYKVIDVSPIKSKDESEFESIALLCSGLVNG